MTDESPDTRDKLRQHRLFRNKPGGGNSAYQSAARLGVRNNAASELTGISKQTISTAARRGKFERLHDGSYHTDQFEAWVRGRGDRDFAVPEGMRGTGFEREDVIEGVVMVHPGANGANGNGAETSSLYTLEQELYELRVQNERLKLESLTFKMTVEKEKWIPRAIFSKTIADAVVQFRESARRVGAQVAPSLTGLDDEYEIKRRVDDVMEAALKRLEDRIREMMEE